MIVSDQNLMNSLIVSNFKNILLMNSDFSNVNFNSSPGSILDVVNTNNLEIFNNNFFNITTYSSGTILSAFNLENLKANSSSFKFLKSFKKGGSFYIGNNKLMIN
jgi:hypothetical protein